MVMIVKTTSLQWNYFGRSSSSCSNGLFRGRLQVSLGLGVYPWSTERTENVVVAGSLLDDEQWHDVLIVRSEKNLNISVDGVSIWRNLTAVFMHMDMNRKVYIGGVPSFSNKRSVAVTESFAGCMEEFNFNGVQVSEI